MANSAASAADVAIAAPTAPRCANIANNPNFSGTNPITDAIRTMSRRWAYSTNWKTMITVRKAQ